MISDVAVKDARVKGKEVFALRDFAKGEFTFCRRHRKVVANHDIALLTAEDQRHLCDLDWDTSVSVPAPGCDLNHSCDSNAMRKGANVYAWKQTSAAARRSPSTTS
jgi:hypothetical protein